MSPKSKEELHNFEQRMHDKGSDGFADGPRPWEHWDESGNQANSRVWEGSARRVYGSRSKHSLGHRLLSLLAFLALTTLLVGIGGVYFSHTQTQQIAQEGVQPLPITARAPSASPPIEPLASTKIIRDVDELNVLTAPAAGTSPGTDTGNDKTADDDNGVTIAASTGGDTTSAESPDIIATDDTTDADKANQATAAIADSNIESVAIETVVTEKSVTTTVYTRNPQQSEPEVIAAIETTPPPFVHAVPPAADTSAADATTLTDETATTAGSDTSGETSSSITTDMDTAGPTAAGTTETQDTLTLTSATEETLTAPASTPGDAVIAAPVATAIVEPVAVTRTNEPLGTEVDEAVATAQTIAPQAAADLSAPALTPDVVEVDSTVTQQDTASSTSREQEIAGSDATIETLEQPAPAAPATETSPAEEATQIALAEPASDLESTTPAETAQAASAVKQPIMPVAKQGDWVINLASYTWKSTASKKLALFKDKGVDAEIFEVEIKGKPMYRIRVTGFESSRTARAGIASIEEALDLEGAWVARR